MINKIIYFQNNNFYKFQFIDCLYYIKCEKNFTYYISQNNIIFFLEKFYYKVLIHKKY